LTVLGLSGALSHDPSAALYIDGKLVAAAEEERFVRDKHAKNRMPFEAAKFCLDFAGIKPADVDAVAIPFAPISLMEPARWHYARRYWYAPDRALGCDPQRQPPLPPLPQAHRMPGKLGFDPARSRSCRSSTT
jgi:carbamoyltransferase